MEAVLTGPMGRTLLGTSEVTIGCDADNALIVADLRTAAHHALVRPDGMGYAIVDLGSEYGTIVNNRWLEPKKAQPLLPGDIIQIGNTSFTFEVFQNPAAIPTGLLGVGVGDVGKGSMPTPASVSPPLDVADYDTGSFNQLPNAPARTQTATPRVSISSLRSLLDQSRPRPIPYTSQPWVPDGTTTYPPQQQLWRQDRRRLYQSLVVMLALLVVLSLIALITSRSTPDKTLDAFCNALLTSNGQLATNQLSAKLQGQQGLLVADLTVTKAIVCAHTPAISSGSSAKSTLTIKFSANAGFPNTLNTVLATLIQDTNGVWKIDTLQGQ